MILASNQWFPLIKTKRKENEDETINKRMFYTEVAILFKTTSCVHVSWLFKISNRKKERNHQTLKKKHRETVKHNAAVEWIYSFIVIQNKTAICSPCLKKEGKLHIEIKSKHENITKKNHTEYLFTIL